MKIRNACKHFEIESSGPEKIMGSNHFRIRQEIANEYLSAKIGVDTAGKEHSKMSSFIPIQAIHFRSCIPSVQDRG